jgi:EmrB/QacA subfamily drug resistance transporter
MPAGATEPQSQDTGIDRATLVIAGVVILGVIMSILDTTIVNVALDTLSRELGAPISTIQWVVTGYLLSLAIVIPLAGWLTERFGSKRVWMVSVALFGAGSALCGLASSAGTLIFFRVLQGAGGGLIMPVSMTVLAQAAGPQKIGRMMSVLGVPMLLGPILGPVLGGLIVDSVSWRWIFYVNVPIALVALVLARRLLHDDAGRADAGRLDWTGFGLLSPGLAGIVFGLSEIESDGGIGTPSAFGPLVAGVILVALFVLHSLRTPRPLIDVRLFRNREFAAAAATTVMLGAALFGAMVVIALYFQVAQGQSALDAGLLLAPQGLGAALSMPFTGRLTDRLGGGRVVWVGCLVMAIASLPLVWVTSSTPHGLVAGLLFLRGLGLGGAMMPAMAAAYAPLQSAQVPRATSALNALQRLGGSVGTAVLAVVLAHQLHGVFGDSGPAGSSVPGEIPPGVRAHFAGPLASAFGHTFAWAAALAVLAVIPAVVLAVAGRSARRGPAEAMPSPAGGV